ncbi:MAG: hydrolase [Rhodobacteraceae bacterium]|nr:MAG: hydrolase [Paracoccaceae bacterium]
MKRFLVVAAVLLTALSPVPLVAEPSDGDALRGTQNANLNSGKNAGQGADNNVAGRYLKTILSNVGLLRKPEPVKVSFSREWIEKQPQATGDEQWSCLSEALYFEARGETVKGQFAVAEVIMNRVNSPRFPETPCGVIKQGTGRKFQCQFTYTCDGRTDAISEKQAYERVAKVARATLDEAEGVGSLTDGATYYHTTAVRPVWARKFKKTAQIGVHLFYRKNYRTAQSE